MPIIQPRDLLCWNSRTQAQMNWEPSPNNKSWRPNLDYYPDTRSLLPGDIVLFQPLKPTIPQKVSQAFQKSSFTHAAIYVGFDHEICEAVPSDGVVLSSLEDSIEDHCILVRRVPNLSDDDRNRIAIEAGKLRGDLYAFRQIFQLAWNRFLKIDPSTDDGPRRGVICSTLCEHAILVVTKGSLTLRRTKNDVVTPARLAEAIELEDVAIDWTRVNQG
jgi:hypothetical protein